MPRRSSSPKKYDKERREMEEIEEGRRRRVILNTMKLFSLITVF